jgi:hypothetical protein
VARDRPPFTRLQLRPDVQFRAYERELANGRYVLASEDAPNVLRLLVSVLDLAADAPEERRSGTEPVLVLDAERIVLTLELRDAVTGQLLARVIEVARAP